MTSTLFRKRFTNASFVDDVYPFIWKNFSAAGYVTLFAEDQAFLGVQNFFVMSRKIIFIMGEGRSKSIRSLGMMNHRLKGFRNPPTDHYTRPYFNHVRSDLILQNNAEIAARGKVVEPQRSVHRRRCSTQGNILNLSWITSNRSALASVRARVRRGLSPFDPSLWTAAPLRVLSRWHQSG